MVRTIRSLAAEWGACQCQIATIIETPLSQTVDGVWNGDAGQARATREAPISQTGDSVGFSVHFDGLRYYDRSFIIFIIQLAKRE